MTTATALRLRGYRDEHSELLAGHWLPAELVGLPVMGRPALAAPVRVDPPIGETTELLIAPGAGFAQFSDIEWIHRIAWLHIGLREEAARSAPELLRAAVRHGFDTLGLRRLYGWVTPAGDPPRALYAAAGFRREATVPDGIWLDGRARDREIWTAVATDD